MAEEQSIGAARIDIVVDTERMRADLKMAESLVRQLGDDYAASFNKMSEAQKRVELAALRFAATQGKSRDEIRLMRLEAMGASEAVLKLAREQLAASRAVGAAAQNINAATVNIKQLQQANRFLPAQFTDIAVSLASGTNPLMVAFQQGGQIMDQFRLAGVGAGGAIKEVAALAMSLVTPATISAAAAAGLGYAVWKLGEDSREAARNIEEISRSVGDMATMGYFAQSEAEIRRFVNALSEVYDVKPGRASAVLAGLDFREQSAELGEMVANIVKLAGGSKEVRDSYVEMANSLMANVNASAQELMLRGYITAEQAKQAKFYDDIGLAAEAQAIIAEGINSLLREQATLQKLKYPELASEYDVLERIRQNNEEINRLLLVGSEVNVARVALLQRENEELRAQIPLVQQIDIARANARREYDASRETAITRILEEQRNDVLSRYGTLRQQREVAIAEATAKYEAQLIDGLSEERRRYIEQTRDIEIAGINRIYDEREKRERAQVDRGGRTNPADALIKRLQDQIALNKEQLRTEDKLTASERLIVQAREELERISGKVSAADRKRILSLIEELTVSGDAVEQLEKERKAREALARQNEILAQQAQNRRYANELDLLAFGRGADAVAQLRRRLDIEREYAEEMKRLGDRSVADDKETWDRMAENARRHRDQQLAEEEEFQRQRVAAMLDWENGVRGAFEDYAEVAINQAGQVRDALTGAFSAAENALVEFVKTGKLEFTDLAESILSDLARIGVRMAAMNLLESSGLLGLFRTDGLTGFASGGAFDSGGVHAFANGGVFTNSIVSKPTLFKFAKGIGLMGEAGPEAIMPLTRTASGRLGVAAVGAGGLQVQVNNYTGAKVAAREERVQMPDGHQLRKLVLDIVADDMAAGGRTASALRGRFGLRDM